MLKSLHVKDYALIEKIDVEFNKGLNIITGETGAGKTILIDAMSLLLGERASADVIRKGSEKSYVEGIFEISDNKKVAAFLKANGIEFTSGNNELIVRREISLKGSNRCFINDTPVQVSVVKELGDYLVDLHGQHEHQLLLRKETHIEYLDSCGDTGDLLRTYKWIHDALLKLENEIRSLRYIEDSLKEKRDVYSFEIKEIDSLSPEPGEEEKLAKELKILESSEKLLELTSRVYQDLYESENSVYDLLTKIKSDLDELKKIDPSFQESLNEGESAVTLVKDISDFVSRYKSKLDTDPQRLEQLRERSSALNLLKKKYGGTIKSILGYRKKINEEFDTAENFSEKIAELEARLKAVRENAGSTAEKLSQKRKVTAIYVQNEIVELLRQLGINNARFEVLIKQESADKEKESYILLNNKSYRFNKWGYDEVEFIISTNPGEDTKPLGKVASGGEISRIMLALKTILAKNDKLPLLIFDEIDTGISGQIAQKVGQALKSLAAFHQIIAITHLPQISGLADYHYAVEKRMIDNRVVSSIKKLNEEERVKEVARLLSGENVTDASLNSARELMGLSS